MQLTARRRVLRRGGARRVRLVALFVLAAAAEGAALDASADSSAPAAHEKPPHAATPTSSSASPSGSSVTESAELEFATYADTDHVTVITPSVRVGVDSEAGASLRGSYLVDVVSAASVDVVSTASSRWREVRNAGTLEGQYKPSDFGVGAGGSVSSEPDYFSYGASASLVKDFDQKNWTVTFGYGFSHDTAGRCEAPGKCTPFSVFSRELQRGTFNGGLAWVVDRATLASLGVDVVLENGDQSKPYRYVPMFAPDVAPTIPRGASIALVNAERLPERPLEQLPLSRRRAALVGRFAHRFDGSTLRLEERAYDDSWGQVASTTDAKWIFDLGSRFALWPHARLHAQTPVSFWQRAYVSEAAPGWSLPELRTGSRELGPLWTAQGGFGVRWFLGGAADPRTWQLGLTGDVMYTSFLDDLYLMSRTAVLGAMTLEGQL
jgi:hypothetical protein